FPLDGVDAVNLEHAALPHRPGRLPRNHAELGLGIAGMGLDLEPDTELAFRLPDRHHFGAGIAWNHMTVPNFRLAVALADMGAGLKTYGAARSADRLAGTPSHSARRGICG